MTQTQPQQATGLDGLDPMFAGAINAMVAASGGRLRIRSGYRSIEEQQALWDDALAKYGSPEAARQWVAPPGSSNHNRGMAVDLEGDIGLAHDLAPRFGLVFPMSWEPWHIEPAGLRDGTDANADAYTQGPPGTQNPTTDQSLSHRPEFAAASLAESLRALMDPTVAGMIAARSAASSAGGSAATSYGGQGSPATVGLGGNVDPGQLYAALKAQGLPPDVAAAFVAIGGRESGYNSGAHNDNADTGDDSYGLFQINLLNGGWAPYLAQQGMRDPAQSLRTVAGSVEGAAALYRNSGLHPWGGYKGANWYDGTDLDAAVAASGGEVTREQLMGLR